MRGGASNWRRARSTGSGPNDLPPLLRRAAARILGCIASGSVTLYVVVVVFVATLIRSTLGFGEAVVAVPLLALRTPVAIAAPLAVAISIVIAAAIVVQDWRRIDFRSAGALVVASLFGIPLGVLLLAAADEHLVKQLLGVVIIGFSIHSLAAGRHRPVPDDHAGWLIASGIVAGVLGGAYGMNGPPLALYGARRGWSPQQFRATLQGYFLPASAAGMLGYASIGLWNGAVTHYFLWSLPGVGVAVLLGRAINHRLDSHRFLRVVYGGLMLIGAALLLQASLLAQTMPAADCREWHECRQLAQDAYARGDYERFHDLAWRTVQTGPPRNPDLMYLLARAQSLSGRPHDALVMLERLAEMKFATAAATDEDFRPVRELRQWPELEAMLTPATAVLPAMAAAPVGARAPDVSAPALHAPVEPVARHADEALRMRGTALGSAGLAYDRVSSRFVVADPDLRKLLILDERSHHLVDLVTAASAGFYDITGFEIDSARGDLWVVSAAAAADAGDRSPASALHKLQLVSGRPLERVPVPADLGPCRLVDVAVTADGRVLTLDAVGHRLLRFRATERTFAAPASFDLASPTSVAPAGDRVAYVAHAAGIARVDTVTGTVEPLASARGVDLAGFERIRWAKDSLVGVQRLADGSQRAVRVKIAGGKAASMEIIDSGLPAAQQAVVAVSGDDVYFLVQEAGGDAVIRRSRLR